METRFMAFDNTYGAGGYVYDKQAEDIVFYSDSMIDAVRALKVMERATAEEVAELKQLGDAVTTGHAAEKAIRSTLNQIREREGLNDA